MISSYSSLVRQGILLCLLFANAYANSPPIPEIDCQDEVGFFIQINQQRFEPCTWIDIDENNVFSRREAQCLPKVKEPVAQACPRACGLCCGDNPAFTFQIEPDIGVFEEVNCAWLQTHRDGAVYCEGNVKYSCPMSCGLCPTASPSPTTAPSPAFSNSPSTGPTWGPTVTESLAFASEIYTTDVNVLPDASTVTAAMNSFLNGDMPQYKDHPFFVTLENAGIKGVQFDDLTVLNSLNGYDVKCGTTPDSVGNSVCNILVGSLNVGYSSGSRRIRKLSNDDIASTIANIIVSDGDSLSDIVDGVNGIVVRGIAEDMAALASALGDSTIIPGNNGVSIAAIVAPVVIASLFAVVALAMYMRHRKKANMRELEAGMSDSDFTSPKYVSPRLRIIQTEDMFPIKEDPEGFYPEMDNICGTGTDSSTP